MQENNETISDTKVNDNIVRQNIIRQLNAIYAVLRYHIIKPRHIVSKKHSDVVYIQFNKFEMK